jgi:hypothetical protein
MRDFFQRVAGNLSKSSVFFFPATQHTPGSPCTSDGEGKCGQRKNEKNVPGCRMRRSRDVNPSPSGPGWTASRLLLGVVGDFDLPGANEFGKCLEVDHSAPQCTRVRPKERAEGQMFGKCLVSSHRIALNHRGLRNVASSRGRRGKPLRARLSGAFKWLRG